MHIFHDELCGDSKSIVLTVKWQVHALFFFFFIYPIFSTFFFFFFFFQLLILPTTYPVGRILTVLLNTNVWIF